MASGGVAVSCAEARGAVLGGRRGNPEWNSTSLFSCCALSGPVTERGSRPVPTQGALRTSQSWGAAAVGTEAPPPLRDSVSGASTESCVRVYAHVCACTCIHVCVCAYVCVSMCVSVCVHVPTHEIKSYQVTLSFSRYKFKNISFKFTPYNSFYLP